MIAYSKITVKDTETGNASKALARHRSFLPRYCIEKELIGQPFGFVYRKAPWLGHLCPSQSAFVEYNINQSIQPWKARSCSRLWIAGRTAEYSVFSCLPPLPYTYAFFDRFLILPTCRSASRVWERRPFCPRRQGATGPRARPRAASRARRSCLTPQQGWRWRK